MRIPHALDTLAESGHHRRFQPVQDLVQSAAKGEAVGLDLRGRAGMGKTRLHQAALDEAAETGLRVVSFRLSLAEARSEAVLARLVDSIREAAPDQEALEPPAVEPETPLDRDYPRPEASVLGVREAAIAFTRSWPLLIAVDNLHLAGRTLLRALREALTALKRDPANGLAILVTTAGDPATGSSLDGPTSLYALTPLTEREIDVIAHSTIGKINQSAVRAVLDRSEGNLHWVREILSHLGTIGATGDEAEAEVRRYDSSAWGQSILADFSDDAFLVATAVAELGRVEPISAEHLAAVLDLPHDRVSSALGEASDFVHETGGGWNMLHELDRNAVRRAGVIGLDAGRWHARAVDRSSTPLAAAMHVRETSAETVPDEVAILRKGARQAATIECIALLTVAIGRADPEVGAEIAREVAALYLYELAEPEQALAQLAGRQPDPEEAPNAFVEWQELRFRALSRQHGRRWSAIESELRNAAGRLPASAHEARKRLLSVRAGKPWMSAEERARIRVELDATPLPARGETADDARLLLAAAEHLAIDGGPAVSEDPKTATVLGLLERCIDGEGLWASLSLRPTMACDVQWMLLCCDAHATLERFETQANERLSNTSPSAHALHQVLVAQRLIGFGELDAAESVVTAALERVPLEWRQLPVGVAVDVFVELGRVGEADELLASSFPADSDEQITDWRLLIAAARVDGNLLRIEHAIERLVAVGSKRARERRRSPAFAWRVDLLRLLRRFRFPDHPASRRWQRLLEPALPGASEASGHEVISQLLSDELEHGETWGAPVPLARAHRAAGEVWAGDDLSRARYHREKAVALLRKASATVQGTGRLEYARAMYELAHQYRGEAAESTGREATQLRRLAAEQAEHAAELAFDMGAAQLWINAWDVHSTAGRRRGLMKPVPDAAMPYLPPDAALVAELAASGVAPMQINDLLPNMARSTINTQLTKLRRLLLMEESAATIAAGKAGRLGRREEWLLFRRLQHQRFREMRDRR